jgi:hypothetical protein
MVVLSGKCVEMVAVKENSYEWWYHRRLNGETLGSQAALRCGGPKSRVSA